MKRQWVNEIHLACDRYGTAFFFKQWGGKNKAKTGRELDGRTWTVSANTELRWSNFKRHFMPVARTQQRERDEDGYVRERSLDLGFWISTID